MARPAAPDRASSNRAPPHPVRDGDLDAPGCLWNCGRSTDRFRRDPVAPTNRQRHRLLR